MPSSPEDDDSSASSIAAPVAKRRASQPHIAPLRISAVKTKPPPTTPNKRVSGNGIKGTPNTAPARPKTGTQKRNEPTLLGDFLLGRPSPARKQRRKSLEVVKQELKVANVGTIQVPGGVKDRVKQWQKTNAAAVVIEDPNAESEEDESKPSRKDKVPEGVDEMSVDEDERLRIKFRKGTKPGRRKEKDDDEISETHSKSTTAPKKRVVSDEHWRKTRTLNKKSPANRNASQKIPKDFLVKTVVKEPLAQRVQDWIKVSETPPPAKEKKSRPSRSEPRASKLDLSDSGIRVKPISSSSVSLPKDDGIRVRPLSSSSISRPKDDGIRVRAFSSSSISRRKDDGIRTKRLDDSPTQSVVDEDIRVKSIRKDGSKRRPKESKDREEAEIITPTHRPEKHLRPPAEFPKSRNSSQNSRRSSKKHDEQDDTLSAMTPSPHEKSKKKVRKSETPSDFSEIPFGSSAFSVLELPLGAEANTMPSRRPPPKRNPSFGVPKVLKKVYNAVHDTSEPQRGGPNQPASIESWLHKTSDPFTERPTPPQSVVGLSDPVPSTEATQEEEDESKFEMNNTGTVRRKRRSRDRKSLDELKTENVPKKESSPPLEIPKTRDAFPSMDRPSPISPSGLRRSPATRNASSPKNVKKNLFKDAILDAFKGESAVAGKSKDTNPFLAITGLREREVNRTPSYFQRQDRIFESEDTPTKENPLPREKTSSEQPSPLRTRPPSSYSRRPPPTGNGHRLSTIASIETFKSSSSATDTASDISQTTITQDTVLSRTTASSISRKSNNRPSKPGVKRRLTKHSDLLSMLSLPDNLQQQGRSTSIKSARSVRTTRSRIETATSNDFMKELAEDEAKYIRELKTLVDGVIPVLLTCVLSKSDSAVAAGLFNPNAAPGTDKTLTKPIVDMGIALERLNSLHKRIPLEDPDAFFTWANQARKTYHDYLLAWRSGFQDVVVNLAPASRSASAEGSKPMADEMARNSRGDVIRSNGERVDVAYLLKRPLVRVKYLTKAINGLTTLKPIPFREKVRDDWNVEETFTRKRSREEDARRVDQAANATDPTRARNPRNLAPMDNVKIDQTRQVCAKDYFSLDISHSNGQRIECRVEILMRDKISDPTDSDILICEVDSFRRFLLFPPISKDCISARVGDNKNQLAVMIRGIHESSEWQEEWKETFILEAEDEDAAEDWLEMFGIVPVPPQVRKAVDSEPVLSELSVSVMLPKHTSPSVNDDIPIGERRRREAEKIEIKQEKRRSSHARPSSSTFILNEEDLVVGDHVTDAVIDLNDAMNKAGTLLPAKRTRASRYHSKIPSLPSDFVPEMSGGLDPYPEDIIRSKSPQVVEVRATSPEPSHSTTKLPHIPKLRPQPAVTYSSTPLKESMRPEFEATIKQPLTPETIETIEDVPPPPPPHRTLTPTGLKNTPVLDSATPKAKARRSSSPLKHEYQPSTESGTSSSEVSRSESSSESETESDYSSDYTDEDEDEDELEAIDMPSALPGNQIYSKRVSPDGSMYSVPNSTLAPSNSASQGPYRGVPAPLPTDIIRKNTAYIFGWSESNGIWVPLFPEPCSVVVSPGLVESFRMSATHSSHPRNADGLETPEVPLLAQVVTPVVLLRQSNALDIEIRVPPVQTSVLVIARGFKIIRYRATNNEECTTLYNALHRARLENPTYKRLEEERRVNGFGSNNFDCTQQPRRKSWIFGRKKSYRASTRAPSEGTESEQSGNTRTSALSALRSMSGGAFNIARSTIDNQGSVRPSSNYTSNPSDYSSPTPPRTPTSGSLMGSTYSSGVLAHRGSENMKIRLYELHSNSKWNDLGPACLTVTIPAPGMRQASSLNHGIERRIIITRKATQSMFSINTLANLAGGGVKANDDDNYIFLDIILGASCFSKVGRTGVCANVWEDIAGPNGEVGMIGATGGVAGRTRKWLFQTGCQSDANWVFSLCAIGRNC